MDGRTLHGVNLAGWLVMQSWVTPELFADSGALDESTLIRSLGEQRYHDLARKHRESFLSSSDFVQMAGRGFNAARLVVPWYVFGAKGPENGPYLGCIEHVDNALEWAEDVGIKLLLVLGIDPGREQDERYATHRWTQFSDYRKDMVRVLATLAKRYAMRDGLLGFEVANSPQVQTRHFLEVSPGVSLHELRTFYRDAYAAVRKAAGDDPIVVVPDAGKPEVWRAFMGQRRYKNVWLDAHLHHYNDKTDVMGPVGVRSLVASSERWLSTARKSGLPVMVGEWSGSLPFPDSLMTPEGRIAMQRVYVAEQIGAFADCPAWFFQTWKTSARLSGWDARVALATFERRMLD
jgi:glucan 1,3-beta-glucosidase